MRRLKSAGVRFSPTSWVRNIGDCKVTLYDVHTEAERILEGIDAVILSTGRVPLDGLARELAGKVSQLFTIGDALAARPLAAATYEGQKFARCIGEPGEPATVHEAYFRADGPELMPLPADVVRPSTSGTMRSVRSAFRRPPFVPASLRPAHALPPA